MCGRFSQYWVTDEWERFWPAEWRIDDGVPRYNVGPGTLILAIVHGAQDKAIGGPIRWGIKTSHGLVINARVETMASRPLFRALVSSSRLIIPMNGYYEWHQETKQPYYLHDPYQNPLWALGLYQRNREGSSAVIITRPAPPSLAGIHNRMPLLADRDMAERWLNRNPQQPMEVVQQLLMQFPQLLARPVSTRVNNTRNDDPSVMQMVNPD